MKDIDFLISMTWNLNRDQLFTLLIEAVEIYKKERSAEAFEALSIACMMVAGKEIVNSKGIQLVQKEIEELKRIKERLNSQS